MLYVTQPSRQRKQKAPDCCFYGNPTSASQPLVDPMPRILQLQLESPNWPCPALSHSQEWFS